MLGDSYRKAILVKLHQDYQISHLVISYARKWKYRVYPNTSLVCQCRNITF